MGPPRDIDAVIGRLREAVASGVNHIDTADFYGPHVTNQIIRRALSPYPDDLLIVTKVGARRGENGSRISAFSRRSDSSDSLNLRNLARDVLDVVNLRSMFGIHESAQGSIEAPLTVLAELQQKGLVRHFGLSNVTPAQIAEARRIAAIVCVQNHYNLAHRTDGALIADLARTASPTCHSFHSAGSLHSSRLPGLGSPRALVPRPCSLRLVGFFSGRPISW